MIEMYLNNFIKVNKLKNGKLKITHDQENERNILKFIYGLGYRRTKLGSKNIYFRKVENDLLPVSINDIRREFYELLKEFRFCDIPEDIVYTDVLNWYLDKRPLKENKLLKEYLGAELTEKETHNLRIKTDVSYKHEVEISLTLSKFREWNLKKVIDTKSSICTNAPLYYKNIDVNKYLIFSHFNAESKNNIDGFDCWIASFKNENQIGKNKPTQIEDICLSFNLSDDLKLINDYI